MIGPSVRRTVFSVEYLTYSLLNFDVRDALFIYICIFIYNTCFTVALVNEVHILLLQTLYCSLKVMMTNERYAMWPAQRQKNT